MQEMIIQEQEEYRIEILIKINKKVVKNGFLI